MPLSLRLALLVAAGAAAGLFGPANSTRLLASITAAAAAGAWLASTNGIVGARTVLVAASVAGARFGTALASAPMTV